MKAYVDNKTNVSEKWKYVLGRVENIVGKGENAGYQHLLLFPTWFSKGFFLKVIKSWGLCGKELNILSADVFPAVKQSFSVVHCIFQRRYLS